MRHRLACQFATGTPGRCLAICCLRPEDTKRENILAEAGYEQVYDIDEIITRMPTPDGITRLGIPAGTPVAEHIRTGYTANGKPVRVMISIVPGDTLILQYVIPT